MAASFNAPTPLDPSLPLQGYVLAVTQGEFCIPFRLQEPLYRVGRGHECTIRVSHPEVSRVQAILLSDQAGRFQLLDGDGRNRLSTNGTYVNCTRITQHWLYPGDVILLGSGDIVAYFLYLSGEEDHTVVLERLMERRNTTDLPSRTLPSPES